MIPRIKICCISSTDEALTAIKTGAAALGLVGKMPSGPGVISDELIYRIARMVPPPIGTFLLTSETSSISVIEHYRRTCTTAIQLVDSVSPGTYAVLRTALPGVKLVQVIHVLDESSIDEAVSISDQVDVILLDSGNPNLQVKELGGTGRTHNWKLSRKICEAVKIPVFLAGGIHAGNVRQAIEEVQPFGIDLCNGVRSNGNLDPQKLDSFFGEIMKLR